MSFHIRDCTPSLANTASITSFFQWIPRDVMPILGTHRVAGSAGGPYVYRCAVRGFLTQHLSIMGWHKKKHVIPSFGGDVQEARVSYRYILKRLVEEDVNPRFQKFCSRCQVFQEGRFKRNATNWPMPKLNWEF